MDKETLSFKVDPELKRDLEELAEYRDLSVSDIARDACREAVREYRQELVDSVSLVESILKDLEKIRQDAFIGAGKKRDFIKEYHALLRDAVNGKQYRHVKSWANNQGVITGEQ